MLTYALLIRKYNDDLQSLAWNRNIHIDVLQLKEKEYQRKMNRIYRRLHREYNFTKQKFYALQEQSLTL